MSNQMAPAPLQASPQGVPANVPGTGSKVYDLHKCAMDAEKALEKLATELGKGDAPPKVVASVSQMADMARKIAMSVANLPGPPASATPAPAGPPAQGSAPPRETLGSATNALAAAAARKPAY